jgi:hypothetical protein
MTNIVMEDCEYINKRLSEKTKSCYFERTFW